MPTYTPEFEAQVIEWSRQQQSSKRFAHTERVVETVTWLAAKWSPDDTLVCRLACWLHDAAKRLDEDQLLGLAIEHDLPVTPFEAEVPMLLHGLVAYALAAKHFHLDDHRLYSACAYHTSGSAEMSLIDKLVFLADKIEPARDYPGVDRLRQAALENLDWACLHFVEGSLQHLIESHKRIDPRLLDFYNLLLKIVSS